MASRKYAYDIGNYFLNIFFKSFTSGFKKTCQYATIYMFD